MDAVATDGFSMEKLISSMQKHLLSNESSTSACLRPNGDTTDSHVSVDTLSQMTQPQSHDRGQSHDPVAGAMYYPQPDSEDEIEYELTEEEHPRLTGPFYEDLRRKYPRAFRRRTSVSSACSASSSVCSDTSGVFGTRRTPKSQVTTPRDNKTTRQVMMSPRDPHSLPPRPPASARRTKPTQNGNRLGEAPDPGLYSSSASLDEWRGSTCSMSRNNLKERLRKNQESWKELLSDENNPLNKCRTPRSHPNSARQHSGSHGNRHSDTGERRFQELQNTTTAAAAAAAAAGAEASQKRTLALDTNSRQARAKRFASPDSQTDSAVDMDTASVHSSPTSDTRLSKPVAPSRTKRKSADKKGNKTTSPRLSSQAVDKHNANGYTDDQQHVNTFVNGVGDLQLRLPEDYHVHGQHPSRSGALLSPTVSDFDLPVFSIQNRADSDVDSGIAHGWLAAHRHEPLTSHSSNDEDTESVIFAPRPPHQRQSGSHPHRHAPPPGHRHHPVRVNRGVHGAYSPGSPDTDPELDYYTLQGARPKVHSASIDNLLQETVTSGGYHPRKRERVTFEDEVMSDSPLSLRQRSSSQPMLFNCSQSVGYADPGMDSGSDMWEVQSEAPVAAPRRRRNLKLKYYSQENLQEEETEASCYGSPYASLASQSHQQGREPTARGHDLATTPTSRGHDLGATPTSRGHDLGATPTSRGHTSRSKVNSKSEAELHSARPAVVTAEPVPTPPARYYETSSDNESEAAGLPSSYSNSGTPVKEKKSRKLRLPWKRNKGRYTPSEEIEKAEAKMLRERSSSYSSLQGENTPAKSSAKTSAKPPTGKKSGKPAPVPPPVKESQKQSSEHVRSTKPTSPRTRPPRPPSGSRVYEDVDSPRTRSGTSSSNPDYEAVDISQPRTVPSKEVIQPDDGYAGVEFGATSSESMPTPKSDDPYEAVDLTSPGKVKGQEVKGQSGQGQGGSQVNAPSNAGDGDTDLYSQVDLSKKKSPRQGPSNCVSTEVDQDITELENPPVPPRGYDSDLERHADLSASQTSLSGRKSSFKDSARRTLGRLRRAISLEKLDKTEKRASTEVETDTEDQPGELKKSPSIRSLTESLSDRFSFRKKKSADGSTRDSTRGRQGKPPLPPSNKRHGSISEVVDKPTHFRPIGKLKHLNPDGTQVVKMMKPPHGPFGFYIARGNAKFKHGIFVSRLSDGLPQHFFAGLMGIGDEILEIDGIPVSTLELNDVYDIMADKEQLTFKTLPYMARKDV